MGVALLELNIDLPTNCYNCPFKTIINEDKVTLWCNLRHATFEGEHFYRKKHTDCPIKEIPKIPGRLLILSENIIEANKVVMSFSTQRWISEGLCIYKYIIEIKERNDETNNDKVKKLQEIKMQKSYDKICSSEFKDNDDYKCKNCSKAYTDDCPKEKCWKNNYSEFIEENK